MATHRRLFTPDGHYQYSVHIQSSDRGAPSRRKAYEMNIIPPKVLAPGILPWIIKSRLFASLRINRRLARCFAERARHTSQSQILGDRLAAGCQRSYVVYMKRGLLSFL